MQMHPLFQQQQHTAKHTAPDSRKERWPLAQGAPGNRLEMQGPRPHPDLLSQSVCEQDPRRLVLKCEHTWLRADSLETPNHLFSGRWLGPAPSPPVCKSGGLGYSQRMCLLLLFMLMWLAQQHALRTTALQPDGGPGGAQRGPGRHSRRGTV